MRSASLSLLPCLTFFACSAQDASVGQLRQRPDVNRALELVRSREPAAIERQVAICQTPAPPFQESKRAEVYRRLFGELGLRNVRIDAEGNVLGERPGRQVRPRLVVSAHLDTVFPDDVDVRVTWEGSILKGPGIGDDCRGLAVLTAIVEALNQANLQTEGPVTFVGTVGEEGLGDLRGVKRLFNETLKGTVDRFISIDGTGLGMTNVGVGSHRYRVSKGPGGHSYGAFGMASPTHALGRAIAKIADLQVRSQPGPPSTLVAWAAAPLPSVRSAIGFR
jgi:acetylornithine deacetylase/succinyl-diaminopimelate desuccinylase-like protein